MAGIPSAAIEECAGLTLDNFTSADYDLGMAKSAL
jgi:hypothetical protein